MSTKQKVTTDDINGRIMRDNEVYVVEDNETLEHLTLSKTILHPGKSTSGHIHDGDEEEVYFFVSGHGTMELGDQSFPVETGSIVLIPKKVYHRVHNDRKSKQDLVFICVFEKYIREH